MDEALVGARNIVDDTLQFAEDAANATMNVPGPAGVVGREAKVGIGALKKMSGKGPEIVKDIVKTAEKVIPEIKKAVTPVVEKIGNTGISIADDVAEGAV